ncbi:MAG: hypothetical protein V3U03_17465 [Myxococcota bacterium]
MTTDRERALAGAVTELLALVDDFMPNVGRCALQDYKRLNDAPTAGRVALAMKPRQLPDFYQDGEGPLDAP